MVGTPVQMPSVAGTGSLPDIPGFSVDSGSADPFVDSFLLREVKRTFAFYLRDFPEAPEIDELIVAGPATVGMAQAGISEAVGLPVRIARIARLEPLVPLSSDVEWMAAYGAALSHGATYLPKLQIARGARLSLSRRRGPIVVRMGIAASVLVLASAGLGRWNLALSTEWAAASRASEMEIVESLKARRAPELRSRAAAEKAFALHRAASIPAGRVLARLAIAGSPGVGIQRLDLLPDGAVRIEGEARSSRDVQAFVQSIGRGGELIGAYFETMRQEPSGVVRFRIAARHRADGGGGG